MSYMLIDITALPETRIITVAKTHEVALLAKLYKTEGRTCIAPALEGRGFAKLEAEQLQYIYWNLTQQTPPSEYAELCSSLLELAKKLPVDDTPIEVLEAEVRRRCPDEVEQTASPKTPREPRAPSERPKGTSTTGRVWELADKALAETYPQAGAIVDWKVVRAALMRLTDAEGINSATAATQYSKWKASKLATPAA